MKAEVYAQLHAFSSAFEQAWDAAQKLQPHLELSRDEMKRIYFRLQQARLETLVVLNELGAGYERTCEHRIRKQKAQWETQEAVRIRKRDEAEKARWAWEKRNKKKRKSRGS